MLKKSQVKLLNESYNNPKTIPLFFHFPSHTCSDCEERLKNARITENAYATLIDDFFTQNEAKEFRTFSENASFSREIYGSPESQQNGEKPAKAMNSQEKWQFFNSPPPAIKKLYALFGHMAKRDNMEVMTLPWELTNKTIGSPCFATNYLTEMSEESMFLGRHADYDPTKGLAYTIPKHNGEYIEPFENGSKNSPKMLTVMLYSTAENFTPACGMGTVFYKDDEIAYTAECKHMRLCLFKGDLVHNIEATKQALDTYRISYVFKLIFTPKP
ncbi:MAG: hypothetical protein SP1CHLAM54_18090 [Chlamydiia bacterium]|nr:hypothetical protein [Chlamydiia bacterium]MCH9616695.1 hypothetical protein [Chlamydiia bacterium]MCH9629426.1 hypothetical protein [Chlamydiia bacterium]